MSPAANLSSYCEEVLGTTMHLIYVDDSRDEQLCVFSALALPVDQWHEAFRQVREFRRELRRAYGIYVYKELHAWKFVSGQGIIRP